MAGQMDHFEGAYFVTFGKEHSRFRERSKRSFLKKTSAHGSRNNCLMRGMSPWSKVSGIIPVNGNDGVRENPRQFRKCSQVIEMAMGKKYVLGTQAKFP
jgi:hypothetical protein